MSYARPKKIAIFIIAYEAEKTILSTYERIPESLKKAASEIYIIDDCSPDKTYAIAAAHKASRQIDNLSVYKNRRNLGHGKNQKRGYRYAVRKNYDVVALLHGDAQYAPERIPELIEPLLKGEAEMVIGSRMSGQPLKNGMPFWKYLANKFLTSTINKTLGLNLTEYHSGFRAYSVRALSQIPFIRLTNGYHLSTQMLIFLKEQGMRIQEIPIPTHYGPESRQIGLLASLRYGLGILSTLVQYKRNQATCGQPIRQFQTA